MKIGFFLIIIFGFLQSSAQSLKGAAALRVITPNPLLPVSGGVGIPKEVTSKKGELYARVMVLQYDTVKVALVSVDNLGWPAVLGNKTRELVKSIRPENILIAATHTHSAPDAYGFPDETGRSYADKKHLDWCTVQIADAIKEAESNLEEINIKLAHEEIANGIAYNYYAPDLYDPRCGVLQIISKRTGKPVSTLVNYAVHPEVIGSKRGILSPDVCGPLYDYIEQNGGGMAIFFNGALGGMVTADNRRQESEENTWEECIRIGRLLGSEVLRIVKKSAILEKTDLKVVSQTIEFSVESPIMKFILEKSPMGYRVSKDNKLSTVQNFVKIGSAAFLTIPGEALPNIGFYLKRKMNSEFPFLLGLTNDAFGYILTKEDFNSFKRYDYISRTSLGEHTGEILVNESLKLLKNKK
jgi:hypothetical protein